MSALAANVDDNEVHQNKSRRIGKHRKTEQKYVSVTLEGLYTAEAVQATEGEKRNEGRMVYIISSAVSKDETKKDNFASSSDMST